MRNNLLLIILGGKYDTNRNIYSICYSIFYYWLVCMVDEEEVGLAGREIVRKREEPVEVNGYDDE